MTANYKTNTYTGLPDRINDSELTDIDSILFDVTHSATPQEGLLSWNATDGTLDLGLIGGTVNMQIGQEVLVRAKNDEGVIINNGDVVYLSGADGNNPLIKLADADTVVGSAVLGLATEQIAVNGHGYVTTFGRVRDLNTNSFNAGDVLYLSQTAGQLTTTPPSSPAKVVKVGTVLRKNTNNGIVLVSVHVETDLSSKQDVLVSGTNIKTVNGNTLLGPGNVTISASATWGGITGTLSSQTDLQSALDGKQPIATVLTNTTASFTTAQETKLAGIAAGAEVNVNADWNAVSGDAQILNKPTIPTLTSQLTNDSGFITSNAVSSVNSQTGAVILDADDLDDTSTINKFVTSADLTKLSNLSGTNTGDQDLSGKQDILVSGTNIKTVNGNTLLGSGNVSISSSVAWGGVTGTLSDQTDLQTALNGKSDTGHTHAAADIVSGTIATARLGSGTANSSSYLRGDQTWATIAGGGDVTGQASSVDNEIALFSGTGGKTIKRATNTGLLKASSGVIATATPITDYLPGYTQVATLASDQATAANTTPVTLTGLSFSYEANSKYVIEVYAGVAPTANTTGCGFQFDMSTTFTSLWMGFYHQLATTGTLSGGSSVADDASLGVSSGMPGTATYPVIVSGILITDANAGTAQLRFRSETTAVTTCKAGTTLVVRKIA